MAILPYRGFLGQQNKVSNFGGDPRYLEVLSNCNTTFRSGQITKDPGYAQFGNNTIEANQNPTGLFDFTQSPTVQRAFVTINNDAGTNLTLYYHDAPYTTATAWTNISAGASWNAFEDCTTEMASFLGYCYIVGYDATDDVFLPNTTITGTTFSTVDGTADMAQGRYIIRYRDRLYVLNTLSGGNRFPYRAYFSGSGARTWSTADLIDFDHGSFITGAGVVADMLLVFNPKSCWFYNQSVRKELFAQGCVNHRTIKNYGQILFFANHDGVWITQGGKPTLISQDVRDFLKASANPSAWFAGIFENEYWLYIGNVTVNFDNENLSFVRTALVYNILENSWHVRELAHIPTLFMNSILSTGIKLLHMGASNGLAYTFSRYEESSPSLSYGGSDISAFFRTRPLALGDEVNEKEFKKLYAYSSRAQGMKLKGRWISKNRHSNWIDIGDLNKQFEVLDIPSELRTGLFLQLEGSERSQRTPFNFKGLNIELEEGAKGAAKEFEHE